MKKIDSFAKKLATNEFNDETTLCKSIYETFIEIIILKVSSFNFGKFKSNEDVAHDVLIKLFSFSIVTWKSKRKYLIPFVLRVTHNFCVNEQKKRLLRNTCEITPVMHQNISIPECIVEKVIAKITIENAKEQLPQSLKSVIEHYLNGFSYEEIAKRNLCETGYSEESLRKEIKKVRDYKCRAFRYMKKNIEKNINQDESKYNAY